MNQKEEPKKDTCLVSLWEKVSKSAFEKQKADLPAKYRKFVQQIRRS